MITDSQFVVCLDHVQDENAFNQDYNNSIGKQMLHADSRNIGNRWFDKTVQFIIALNKEGNNVLGAGFCYEHTPAEGPPIVRMMEHVVQQLANYKPKKDIIKTTPNLYELKLIPDANRERITAAAEFSIKKYQQFVDSLDLQVLEFKDYGKEFIKSFKYSPDSWIQVAISYAYYLAHNQIGACYESASTRKFALGRTDTIRSLTGSLANFFKNPDPMSLKSAIDSHKQIVNDSVNGLGVDRIMLGK
jgi:carnitine O-acetyltransferase